MIHIEERKDGCVITVNARPGAKMCGIAGEHDGALKVSVTSAPEKGKANKAIIDVLSKSLRLRKSQIRLLSGEAYREKRFLIADISREDLLDRVSTQKK